MINLQNLLDDVKYYETVRQLRWPAGSRLGYTPAVWVWWWRGVESASGSPADRGNQIFQEPPRFQQTAAPSVNIISRDPTFMRQRHGNDQ